MIRTNILELEVKMEKTNENDGSFIGWLLTQKDKRTSTGKIARKGLKGRDLYGFKLETEFDLITILHEAPGCELWITKYLPRAKVSYRRICTVRAKKASGPVPVEPVDTHV